MSDIVLVSLISASSALLGALIGAVSGFCIAWHNNRISERKHAREHVMRAAIDYWSKHQEMALSHGKPAAIRPLDEYLVYVAAISRAVFDENLSEESLAERMRAVQKLGVLAHNLVDEFSR